MTTPYPGGYNTDDTDFGNWDPNFVPHFLVPLAFEAALFIMIILLLVFWGRVAVLGEDPND